MKTWTPPRTADEIRAALRKAGTKSGAAALLGTTRPALDRWLKHYGINVETRIVV